MKPRRYSSEHTRRALLQAALREFAQEGMAGARTEHIARAAGVNKALLYYYFQSKEGLYGAVLDEVFSGLRRKLDPVLDQPRPPREKILAYAGAHFDYIASSRLYPALVQRELMRAGRHPSPHLRRIARRFLAPLFQRLAGILAEGIAAGEFRPVDPHQFVPSMIAVIVFYFSSQPVVRAVLPGDPLAPERLAARRAAVLDFISAALFRKSGPAGSAALSYPGREVRQ
jgi:TetR/AcrR family transcriptional regulator